MRHIRYNCPQCSQRLEAEEQNIGHVVACPHCLWRSFVPEKSQSDGLEASFKANVFRPEQDILFSCTCCGNPLVVDKAGANQKIECPSCARLSVVPEKPEVAEEINMNAPDGVAPSQKESKAEGNKLWLAYGLIAFSITSLGVMLWSFNFFRREPVLANKTAIAAAPEKEQEPQAWKLPSSPAKNPEPVPPEKKKEKHEKKDGLRPEKVDFLADEKPETAEELLLQKELDLDPALKPTEFVFSMAEQVPHFAATEEKDKPISSESPLMAEEHLAPRNARDIARIAKLAKGSVQAIVSLKKEETKEKEKPTRQALAKKETKPTTPVPEKQTSKELNPVERQLNFKLKAAMNAGPDSQPKQNELEHVQRVLENFFVANNWRKKSLFVLQPKRVSSVMQRVFPIGSTGKIDTVNIRYAFRERDPVTGYFIYTWRVQTRQNPRGYYVILLETPMGYKVDWEIFAQGHFKTFQNFINNPNASPAIFRVRMERAHYFRSDVPDKKNKVCLRLFGTGPDTEETYAFIQKGTPLGDLIEKRLMWNEGLPAILSLYRINTAEGHSYIELTRLWSFGWNLPQ